MMVRLEMGVRKAFSVEQQADPAVHVLLLVHALSILNRLLVWLLR